MNAVERTKLADARRAILLNQALDVIERNALRHRDRRHERMVEIGVAIRDFSQEKSS